jgi:hypothetical protein
MFTQQPKVSKVFFYAVILTALAGFLSACGMPMRYSRDITMYEPMKEVSVIKELELAIPKGGTKKAEVPFMVAFVKPSYETTPVKTSVRAGYMTGYTGVYKKSDIAKEKYLDTLGESLKTDIDYMLLQKNIRVLGTFTSKDEMTFDQKKRAIYAFSPKIAIVVDEQKIEDRSRGYSERGTFTVRGYIALWLYESITGEKLWVKRIEAQPISRAYEFAAKFKEPQKVATDIDMLFASGIEEKDTSDKALADALSEFYTLLVKKLWDHIDPEEWSKYLNQAEKLRQEKRY